MGKPNSKLKNEQVKTLAQQTYFTEKEIRQWYKGFIRDCPNCLLTEAGFQKIYKQFFPQGDPSDFASFVFKVFDENKGLSDFTIWTMASLFFRDEEHKLSDGFITRSEMLSIVGSIYKMVGDTVKLPEEENTPEKRVDRIFRMMDKNNDAQLTLDEFKEGAKNDPSIMSNRNRRCESPMRRPVEFEINLPKLRKLLTPNREDETASWFLERAAQIKNLYDRSRFDLFDAVSAAMRNPDAAEVDDAVQEREKITRPEEMRTYQCELASLGYYMDFLPSVQQTALPFPVLLFVDAMEESLLANVYSRISVAQFETSMVVTYRSGHGSHVFRHLILPPFAFEHDPRFRVAEYETREFDNAIHVKVTVGFRSSIELKLWRKAVFAMNPIDEDV
ncbi:hypothetical protein M3Y98_00686100 [Aphelenchoides besseyi]|nr:hypothetical protein M3Y98_00686100 [Aphelenchoides besseyi]KAI6209043.1 hypothetical protein M3Y96_00179300 [Aphelenchoides besseyi]